MLDHRHGCLKYFLDAGDGHPAKLAAGQPYGKGARRWAYDEQRSACDNAQYQGLVGPVWAIAHAQCECRVEAHCTTSSSNLLLCVACYPLCTTLQRCPKPTGSLHLDFAFLICEPDPVLQGLSAVPQASKITINGKLRLSPSG